MDAFNRMCEDLTLVEPVDAQITPPPYIDGLSDTKKVEYYFMLIKRAQRRRDRIGALMYAFYLGELIEVEENFRKIAITRAYYIFEVNPDQIVRTQYMSLTNIRKLSAIEYQLLLPDY